MSSVIRCAFKDGHLKPGLKSLHPKGRSMKALTRPTVQRQALLDEYRIAVRMWSETKALYPEESAEVAQATGNLIHLEENLLKLELHPWQEPNQPPVPATEL